MFSQLFIVNQVLNELGQPVVTAVTDSQTAQIIANKLNLLLPELLLRTSWNFAIKYVSNSTPNLMPFSPEFQYAYNLPADYGRMDNVINYCSQYRIVDGMILTNLNPITYYYVVNNCDYSVISACFARALIQYCAYEVCYTITQDETLAAEKKMKWGEALNDAILQNDMERDITGFKNNDYRRINLV